MKHPKNLSLHGKNVLITAGPTREYIDAVRFISNGSSGLMGYALAKEAVKLGSRVVLVSGPVNQKAARGVKIVPVVSAADMLEACKKYFNAADICIGAAAVCDIAPQKTFGTKLKKEQLPRVLRLSAAADVLKYLGSVKKNQVLAGFSLGDTARLTAYALSKMRAKKLDFIFVNPKSNIDNLKGTYTLLHSSGAVERLVNKPKSLIAKRILKFIIKLGLSQA